MKLQHILAVAILTVSQARAQNPVDAYMGDWQGSITVDGKPQTVAGYMIPLANGNYEFKICSKFNARVPVLHHLKGFFRDASFKVMDNIPFDVSRVVRSTDDGVVVSASIWTGQLENNVLKGQIAGLKSGSFELKHTERSTPTLGQQPPAGAVVLFDGNNLDQWIPRDGNGEVKWKLVEGGAMEVNGGDIKTKEKFGDCKLHIEFRIPYMPTSFGQGRGNSGVYMHGRYENQVLDSYGLEGEDNDCGGIYQISKPAANMSFPPLQWQTYDITFHAPRFDADGKKIANARITNVHNGVTIQDNLELPRVTGGAISDKETTSDVIYLQDHGNPVQYRNIWVQKL